MRALALAVLLAGASVSFELQKALGGKPDEAEKDFLGSLLILFFLLLAFGL